MRTIPGSPIEMLTRAALVLAPVLLLASSIAYIAAGEFGEESAGGLLQVLSMATFVLAVIALVTIISEVAPRGAGALLLLGCAGCAGGVSYGINAIVIANGGTDLNELTGAASIVKVIGPIFPLVFVAIGLTLWRKHLAPAAGALAIVVGAVLFPVSRIGGIAPIALAADALLLIGLTTVALTRSDSRVPV
ncbi:MAG: hypothetical protein ABIN55_05240 [Aeromicrobium sp.]